MSPPAAQEKMQNLGRGTLSQEKLQCFQGIWFQIKEFGQGSSLKSRGLEAPTPVPDLRAMGLCLVLSVLFN